MMIMVFLELAAETSQQDTLLTCTKFNEATEFLNAHLYTE